MATILLSAAGASLGGALGGTVAGLSTAVIGRAVGATLGRVIDQKLLGSGSKTVETPRVDRFRLSNAGEGEAISQIYGQMRVGGQVIWASDFQETTTRSTSGGGKGQPSQPKTTTIQHSYTVNLAVAVCEGIITGITRIWADGEEVPINSLNMRLYPGNDSQVPDPLMEAIEGTGEVPAYRGTAYVVFENLALEQFGNRVPQFSFAVSRPDQPSTPRTQDLARAIEAVALMPGTGEYALSPSPVNYSNGPGSRWSANINNPSGATDFNVSMKALGSELPNAGAASLIVSWFGDDLRCASCQIKPKVEQTQFDGESMPWTCSGLIRASAETVPQQEDKPVYGGTPADQSVVEAIQALHSQGKAVMFYPFILMEQLAGNGRDNPYAAGEQPSLPWRGRITLNAAPGQPGSSDGTQSAETEVAQFFGSARASHFTIADNQVMYSGPDEWSFSRFVLHYAALCQLAGGVDSFCIGSEMRGMTWIRAAGNTFPFVTKLRQLAGDVRALLPESKLSYAADWSEYFGYQPNDGSGDRFFHLDPLWADPNIDFIGIDNYMPLSDWRSGEDHADAHHGAIYDLDYLRGNIEGGEGYDWYYASQADRDAQIRTAITDGAHDEPWVFRNKDLRGWWDHLHYDRIGGVRQAKPSAWLPQSKPFWFTEYGCAAIDKGTNQPNKFLDPKSSESQIPHYSNERRDDFIQMQYIRAMASHYGAVQNNPVSGHYGGAMVDMSRAFIWAWDARPYPYFPNNQGLWSDGDNYAKGHWINGRTSARPLSSVVEEICAKAGVGSVDTSQLHGYVRGYMLDQVSSGRQALQPLMLRYGFDAVERDGQLKFVMRQGQIPVALDPEWLAVGDDLDGVIEATRDPDVDMSGRVRLNFVQADGDFEILAEEAVLPQDESHAVSISDVPLALTRSEGRQTVERWLSEARVARDTIRFALPPSEFDIGAGDLVTLPSENGGAPLRYRVDRVEQGSHQILEAVRSDPSIYTPSDVTEEAPIIRPFSPPVPVTSVFLDLPLLSGDEVPHAPFVAASSQDWPGSVAVYSTPTDSNYTLNTVLSDQTVMGLTQTPLYTARHGLWDMGADVQVKLFTGALESAQDLAVFAGANLAAIGDGTPGNWELFQFSQADLVDQDTYALGRRLRGQHGTDALMPKIWPAGSWFVLLGGGMQQLNLGSNLRQVSQSLRIGPAQQNYDHPAYAQYTHAFDGNGLRPYAPAHLRVTPASNGDFDVSWIRRTRIDGDIWAGEVPLGEDLESYRVQVVQNGGVVRSVDTQTPGWRYPSALQTADGMTGLFQIRVAQISPRFGPGLVAQENVIL
ncbi:MAG: glycoside hydrolase/phage tail family protein [Paracoccaceae bacterium]